MTYQNLKDVASAVWTLITLPYVAIHAALGILPFGGFWQGLFQGIVWIVVLGLAWRFLPRHVTMWVFERARSLLSWIARKLGWVAVEAFTRGKRVEFRDRVVYKTSWRARAGFFVKDVFIALFLALGATLYFNKTVIPWLSWVGGMVR